MDATRCDGSWTAHAEARVIAPLRGDALCERDLALDPWGRRVVLLRLRAEHARDPAVCAAWLAQAERNARLAGTEGVQALRHHGMHAGVPCAWLDHPDGSVSLADVLLSLRERGGGIPPPLAVHAARALCGALAAAHALEDERGRGLFHGDLSPARVMVAADGGISLSEFGFWSSLPPRRAAALRRGAAAEHLAPELANGAAIDAQSDLFALGTALRGMLDAGVAPGSGETRLMIVPAARALVFLLGRLLAQKREERAASVDEVVRALARMPCDEAGRDALARLNREARARRSAEPVPPRTAADATLQLFAPPDAHASAPLRDPLERRFVGAGTSPRQPGLRRARGVPGAARGPWTARAGDAQQGSERAMKPAEPPSVVEPSEPARAPCIAAPARPRAAGRCRRPRWRDASPTLFLTRARRTLTLRRPGRRPARSRALLVSLATGLALVGLGLLLWLLS